MKIKKLFPKASRKSEIFIQYSFTAQYKSIKNQFSFTAIIKNAHLSFFNELREQKKRLQKKNNYTYTRFELISVEQIRKPKQAKLTQKNKNIVF